MIVLQCKQGKQAELIDIEPTNDAMREAIGGGYLEARYVSDDVVALVDESAKLKGLKPNRVIKVRDWATVICGDFIFCGVDNFDFTSLPVEARNKLLARYKKPDFEG